MTDHLSREVRFVRELLADILERPRPRSRKLRLSPDTIASCLAKTGYRPSCQGVVTACRELGLDVRTDEDCDVWIETTWRSFGDLQDLENELIAFWSVLSSAGNRSFHRQKADYKRRRARRLARRGGRP